jgi:5-methylcytosine-specific restriction endonuclease McrA
VSPIKPENRNRYPEDWPEIRERILARAGDRCECMGECGCVDTRIIEARRCPELGGTKAQYFRGDVILTIAHLDHTPENSDPSNLKAMCQRCHLRYDRHHHAESARKTRDAKTGQLPLFRGSG